MRIVFLFFLASFSALAQVKSESFIVQINDRSMSVTSPDRQRALFSVIVENRSLSDQVGKFTVGGKSIKFISVKSGKSQAVEIENKSSLPVVFVPISPAFQDVELKFGKKSYEVPPKE